MDDAEIKRIREALEWYAEPANYRYGVVEEQKVGQRARAALEIPEPPPGD